MGQGNEGGGMNPTEAGCDETRPTPAEIDAVMAATRLLVAIGAQSVAKVEDRVAFPQLGVLVMIGDQGPQNLNSVAQALGVHLSNATAPATSSSRPDYCAEATTLPIAVT
jgi:hypothetical protein